MVRKYIVITILLLLLQNSFCSTCTDPNADNQTVSMYQFQETIYNTAIALFHIQEGPTSGDFYSMGQVEGPTNKTLIRRTDESNNLVWAQTYDVVPSKEFFLVDSLESNAYFIDKSSANIKVVEVKAVDGTVDAVLTSTDLSVHENKLRTSPIPNSLGFVFTADSTAEGGHVGCRWLGTNTPLDCFKFEKAVKGYSIIALSSDKFYASLEGGDHNLHFMVADFSNPNVFNWAKYISCGTCGTFGATSTYVQETDEIYNLYNFGSTTLFWGTKASDGSLVDDQFQGNNCAVRYMINYRSRVYFSSQCTSTSVILVYEISNRTMTYFMSHDASLTFVGIAAKGELLYGVGRDTSSGSPYGVMFSTTLTELHSSPVLDEFFLNLPPIAAGTYELTDQQVNKTYFATSPAFVRGTQVSELAATFIQGTSTTSDIAFYVDEITISNLVSGSTHSEPLSPTCSISGSTSLSYSLASFNDTAVLGWTSVSGTDLLITPPTVTVQTTFVVNLETSDTGVISTQTYYLIVDPAPPVTPTPPPPASSGQTQSESVSEKEETMNSVSQMGQVVAMAATGAVIAVVSLNSIISNGSPQGLWAMINQFQFYLLLPIVFDGLPTNIVDFIAGLDFSLADFNFIPIEKLPGIVYVFEKFQCNQMGDYLQSIGVESTCAFVNYIRALLIIALMVAFHVLVLIIYLLKDKKKHTKCTKFIKGVFKAFTFTIYIRYLIEAYLIINLASFLEIEQRDISNTEKIISFSISSCIILFCLFTLAASFFVAKKFSRFQIDEKESFFVEFIKGTKEKFSSRLTVFFHLARVLLTIIWIILALDLHPVLKIGVFVLLQVAFTLLKTVLRPFDELQDNIIEVLNDWTFVGICVFLVLREITQDNETFSESIFSGTIAINSLLILIIQLTFIVISIIRWCRNRKPTTIVREVETTKDQVAERTRPYDSSNFQVHRMKRIQGRLVVEQNRDCMITTYQNDLDVSHNDVSVDRFVNRVIL